MTISYIDAVGQSDHRATRRLDKFVEALGGLIAVWSVSRIAGVAPMTLDDMSPEQLADIGMRRVGPHDAWHHYQGMPRATEFGSLQDVLRQGGWHV